MMTAVVRNLDVNWARILLSLLKDEADQLKDDVDEDGHPFVIVKWKLRLCTKISWMILQKYSVPFNEKKLMPKDQRQLETALGIADELLQKAKDQPVLHSHLIAIGKSNPSWTIPEEKVEQPAGEKRKAAAGVKQQPKSKKTKPSTSTPKSKPLQHKLVNELNETGNKEEHAPNSPHRSPSEDEEKEYKEAMEALQEKSNERSQLTNHLWRLDMSRASS